MDENKKKNRLAELLKHIIPSGVQKIGAWVNKRVVRKFEEHYEQGENIMKEEHFEVVCRDKDGKIVMPKRG